MLKRELNLLWTSSNNPKMSKKNMLNKVLIFDSGSLISLAMNGLFPELKALKEIFNGYFIITEDVKREVLDRPLTIKRFALEALKLRNLYEEKVLQLPKDIGVNNKELDKEIKKIIDVANNTFFEKSKAIQILQSGEISCLALSRILTEKGINNIICIDERTTRVLGEMPKNLEELLRKKLHANITAKKENYDFFKGFRFIRSSELMNVAYKKGLVRVGKSPEVLDALLYAVKFKGCSITHEEIAEINKIG